MKKVLDENDIRYISEFQEYLGTVKESIKDTDKVILGDMKPCLLDYVESLIQLFLDCYFDTVTPEEFSSKWDYLQGMNISVKEMDDTIKRVNALKERKE